MLLLTRVFPWSWNTGVASLKVLWETKYSSNGAKAPFPGKHIFHLPAGRWRSVFFFLQTQTERKFRNLQSNWWAFITDVELNKIRRPFWRQTIAHPWIKAEFRSVDRCILQLFTHFRDECASSGPRFPLFLGRKRMRNMIKTRANQSMPIYGGK